MISKKDITNYLNKLNIDINDFNIELKELLKGARHEYNEHFNNNNESVNLNIPNKKINALKIALAHLIEFPNYYIVLKELNL